MLGILLIGILLVIFTTLVAAPAQPMAAIVNSTTAKSSDTEPIIPMDLGNMRSLGMRSASCAAPATTKPCSIATAGRIT